MVSARMYAGYPSLLCSSQRRMSLPLEPYWYRGLEYPKEQKRGYASNEDLYVPGYFRDEYQQGRKYCLLQHQRQNVVHQLLNV